MGSSALEGGTLTVGQLADGIGAALGTWFTGEIWITGEIDSLRRQARALLRAAGLRVIRASHWNMLLFPLMALRRLLVREGPSSDVQEYPPLLDAVFSAALAIERRVIGWGIDLPFGGSIVVVAVKE